MIRHNIILNGKGGTCKTRTAVFLASYYKSKGLEVQNFDTDSSQAGFAKFEELEVEKVTFYRDNKENKNLENWVKRLIESNCDTITDIGNCDYTLFLNSLEDSNYLNVLTEEYEYEIFYHIPFSNCMDKEYIKSIEDKLLGSVTKNTYLVRWEHFFDNASQSRSESEESLNKIPTIKIPCFSELERKQLDTALVEGVDLNNQEYLNKLFIAERSRLKALSKKIYSAIEVWI